MELQLLGTSKDEYKDLGLISDLVSLQEKIQNASATKPENEVEIRAVKRVISLLNERAGSAAENGHTENSQNPENSNSQDRLLTQESEPRRSNKKSGISSHEMKSYDSLSEILDAFFKSFDFNKLQQAHRDEEAVQKLMEDRIEKYGPGESNLTFVGIEKHVIQDDIPLVCLFVKLKHSGEYDAETLAKTLVAVITSYDPDDDVILHHMTLEEENRDEGVYAATFVVTFTDVIEDKKQFARDYLTLTNERFFGKKENKMFSLWSKNVSASGNAEWEAKSEQAGSVADESKLTLGELLPVQDIIEFSEMLPDFFTCFLSSNVQGKTEEQRKLIYDIMRYIIRFFTLLHPLQDIRTIYRQAAKGFRFLLAQLYKQIVLIHTTHLSNEKQALICYIDGAFEDFLEKTADMDVFRMSAVWLIMRAWSLVNIKEFESALKTLKLLSSKRYIDVVGDLSAGQKACVECMSAEIFLFLGHQEKALQCCKSYHNSRKKMHGERKRPRDTRVLLVCGYGYFLQGKYPDAAEQFTKAHTESCGDQENDSWMKYMYIIATPNSKLDRSCVERAGESLKADCESTEPEQTIMDPLKTIFKFEMHKKLGLKNMEFQKYGDAVVLFEGAINAYRNVFPKHPKRYKSANELTEAYRYFCVQLEMADINMELKKAQMRRGVELGSSSTEESLKFLKKAANSCYDSLAYIIEAKKVRMASKKSFKKGKKAYVMKEFKDVFDIIQKKYKIDIEKVRKLMSQIVSHHSQLMVYFDSQPDFTDHYDKWRKLLKKCKTKQLDLSIEKEWNLTLVCRNGGYNSRLDLLACCSRQTATRRHCKKAMALVEKKEKSDDKDLGYDLVLFDHIASEKNSKNT